MSFEEVTLMWKSYTISKTLPITKQVKLIDPKDCIIVVLNVDSKTFVMQVAIQEQKEMAINFDRKTQIEAQI